MRIFIVRNADKKALEVVAADSAGEALALVHTERPDAGAADAVPDTPERIALSDLVRDSGLSNREFARRVLGRDVRSLARYLGGDTIPPELADQILRMRVESTPQTITIRVRR
jgi:hypothetical protein